MERGGLASIGEDLLENILSRLPALPFASASCACGSWHRLCDRILSRPKLLSALSLNPNLQDSVAEVLDKVLSEPIRPHFAIACVGGNFNLETTLQIVKAKLGFRIPIITCLARGIIGSDALTNEFREVKWNSGDVGVSEEGPNSSENVNRGITLVVGFVPGLKVSAIPLSTPVDEKFREISIECFLADIKQYCSSPLGIVMFAEHNCDMRDVFKKIDYDLCGETVIVGDEKGSFLFSSVAASVIASENQEPSMLNRPSALRSRSKHTEARKHLSDTYDAVALVFAREKDKPHGAGEINFNLALSTGVSPVGPTYKAASVRVTKDGTNESCTWLTARREGLFQVLDGETILSELEDEMENDITYDDFYIGVMKGRKRSIKSQKGKSVSSFAFHQVLGGDEEYLFVEGEGIKTGHTFRFYFPNRKTALVSRNIVSKEFKALKPCGRSKGHCLANGTECGNASEVFGGLIFSCYGRGESFFGDPNVDGSAFLENFPGITLAGMFCTGEIGRGPSIGRKESEELDSTHSCLHVYSSVYLVMSYDPKLQ